MERIAYLAGRACYWLAFAALIAFFLTVACASGLSAWAYFTIDGFWFAISGLILTGNCLFCLYQTLLMIRSEVN